MTFLLLNVVKHNRRIDRFMRRGRAAAQSEWRLVTATHNLLKAPPPLDRRHCLTPRHISFIGRAPSRVGDVAHVAVRWGEHFDPAIGDRLHLGGVPIAGISEHHGQVGAGNAAPFRSSGSARKGPSAGFEWDARYDKSFDVLLATCRGKIRWGRDWKRNGRGGDTPRRS